LPVEPRAGDRVMPNFDDTFAALSAIMRKRAGRLAIKTDEPGNLYVELQASRPGAKPTFFGAVQTKKSYVSYHLMPVYEDPSLLDGISEALRGHMQGKSCFNFKTSDPALLHELDALTAKCVTAAGRAGSRA
jgi:hypothetical protein